MMFAPILSRSFVAAIVMLCVAGADMRADVDGKGATTSNGTGALRTGTFTLHTGFMPNVGQFGAAADAAGAQRVLYAARAGALRVYCTPTGISYVASRILPESAPSEATLRAEGDVRMSNVRSGFRMDVAFADADQRAVVTSYGRRASTMNFLIGSSPEQTQVPEFDHVVYRDVWPGIDAVVTVAGADVRYAFIVHPGGDPARIALRTTGAEALALDARGDFVSSTRNGGIRESAPVAFQSDAQGMAMVDASFALEGDVRRMRVGAYDRSRTLVIDPWVTYFGGNTDDKANAVTTDQRGRIIVTGEMQSYDFPTTPGSFQDTLRGAIEAWFAKFDYAGTRLYASCIGGTGNDYGNAVAIGANGEIVITGTTASTNFPVSTGAFQGTKKAYEDMFLAKFDSAGARVWITFLGGKGDDRGLSVAVDSSRNIVIGGHTLSDDLGTTTTAFQRKWGGWDDGFITKFTAAGRRIWTTYYGGTRGERFLGVAIGEKDNIYLTGRTWSLDFPITANANQSALAGTTNDEDAFIVKMDSSGRRIYASYFGGDKIEIANGIAIDRNKNITIAGRTTSTNLPVTSGALQSTLATGTDAFAASFDSTGAPRWSTYYGGAATDEAFGVAADTTGSVIVVGLTHSANLPMAGGPYTTQVGGQDMFILKFDSLGTRTWSTYYGGTGEDYATAVGTYKTTIYVTGRTASDNVPVYNATHQKKFGADALIAMFTDAGVVPVELSTFSAMWDGGRAARLAWATESEQGNAGFDIERKLPGAASTWVSRGFVAGAGTITQRTSYEYVDEVPVDATEVYYRLRQIDYDGTVAYSPVVRLSREQLATPLAITDVYPQPAGARAQITFVTGAEGATEVTLHDAVGRAVRTLQPASALPVGFHSIEAGFEDLPSGVYHVVVRQGAQQTTRRLVLAR
jgi:hypothetical protein